MTGTTIPGGDHVARICPASRLDGNAMPAVTAFMPRKKKVEEQEERKAEKDLSVNWLEFFGAVPRVEALAMIRETKRDLRIGGNAKLAVLRVSTALESVREAGGIELVAFHARKVDDPSHSGLSGYDVEDESAQLAMAEALHAIVTEADVYPVGSSGGAAGLQSGV